MTTENLLTSKQVCEFIGVSKDTLKRRVKDGTVPVLKVGRLVRFDLDAVKRGLAIAQLKASIPGLRTAGAILSEAAQ
jgi:excisionase family DNA binding protein